MNAVVIDHVPVSESPQAWRDRLTKAGSALAKFRLTPDSSH